MVVRKNSSPSIPIPSKKKKSATLDIESFLTPQAKNLSDVQKEKLIRLLKINNSEKFVESILYEKLPSLSFSETTSNSFPETNFQSNQTSRSFPATTCAQNNYSPKTDYEEFRFWQDILNRTASQTRNISISSNNTLELFLAIYEDNLNQINIFLDKPDFSFSQTYSLDVDQNTPLHFAAMVKNKIFS